MIQHNFVRAVAREPWALLPEYLAELTTAAARLIAGEMSESDLEALLARPGAQQSPKQGYIAVIPVQGILYKRGFWNPGTDEIAAAVKAATADPSIQGIILNIDSPGGSVYGTSELGDAVFAARQAKPTWAVANALAASAAYWVGSQADRFYATTSGDVGSIGVWMAHADLSKALADVGITVTLISAGKYKTEGNPFQPLSDEAKAAFQASVAESYDQFLAAVARGRGVTVDQVRTGMGEGRVVSAARGIELGMIDGVATLDQAIAAMQAEIGGAATGRGRAAEVGDEPEPHATGVAAADETTSEQEPEPPASDAPAERPFRGSSNWRSRQLDLLDA